MTQNAPICYQHILSIKLKISPSDLYNAIKFQSFKKVFFVKCFWQGTRSIMNYFQNQYQTCSSVKQLSQRSIQDAVPLSPSGSICFHIWLSLFFLYLFSFLIFLVLLNISLTINERNSYLGSGNHSTLHSEPEIDFIQEGKGSEYAIPTLEIEEEDGEPCTVKV